MKKQAPLKSAIFWPMVLFGIGLFGFLAFLTQPVLAATSTLRGAAWFGNNYNYLYFNCLDDVIGDRLDVANNLSGAGIYLPPDDKFHFYSPPCVGLVHGVYIGSNGNFTGEAWNPTLDLITFAATTTPPDSYAFNVNCPSTCNLANSCSACYNETSQQVYGWARVIKDGSWIRLDSALSPPVALQSWDLNNSVLPGHGILAGDFIGLGSYGASNLSFNCESEDYGNSNCATRNYKVYVSNLQIGHLSAPNWTYSEACAGNARTAVLKWYKKSGQQTAYEIVVNNSDTLSTSTAVCWSGKKSSTVASQYIIPNSDPTCGTLNYNTSYYWWIRLYDENDTPTEWYQYTTNDALETDLNIDANAKTFTTYKHEFPSPYFNWAPTDVTVGSSTLFTSLSQYYTTVTPSIPSACNNTNCFYLWTTTDLGAIINRPTNSTTSIIFLRATGTAVTLRVTDVDSYVCSTSTLLRINYSLPIWREVKAEDR